MIWDVERPVFKYPTRPIGCMVILSNRSSTQEKVDKTDIFVWKEDFKKVHSKESMFEEKEMSAFPIILGQCSLSLRSQLKGAPKFVGMCKKNDYVRLLKAIRGF